MAFVLSGRATRHGAIMAVNNAVAAARPPPGLTMRAGNGSQYTSSDFRQSAAALGITLEYIYVNTPEQNGHTGSFHKTLKKEYVWPREFASLEEAREAMQDAFADYNHDRIHSALGYITPSEFAELWQQCEAGAVSGNKQIIGGEKCA